MGLKNDIERMEVPKELTARSKAGIYQAHAEERKNSILKHRLPRYGSIVAAVVLAFSIFLSTDSSLANSIKGFFSDITNWNGAVTGTEYENASNEMTIEVGEGKIESDKIVFPLTITLKEPEKAPYNTIEVLTIGEFQLIKSGKLIRKDQIKFKSEVKSNFEFEIKDEDKVLVRENGSNVYKTNIVLDNSNLSTDDSLELNIESFLIQSKGDAPLEVKGEWKYEF